MKSLNSTPLLDIQNREAIIASLNALEILLGVNVDKTLATSNLVRLHQVLSKRLSSLLEAENS